MRFLASLFSNRQSEEGTNNPVQAQGNPPQKKLSTSDLRGIVRFFYFFAVLSVGAVVWYCGITRTAAAPLLWGLACASVGAVFGFLFGIPKILQNDRPVTEAIEGKSIDYRQQVNTNLTEISDWLTKIIVGLGLINLNTIPSRLNNTALILAVSLNPSDPNKDKAFALALILSFLILGFLFGYLSTRLFLQAAFSRADQEAAFLRIAATAIATTEARISTLETKQEYILSEEPAQPNGQVKAETDTEAHDSLSILRSLADNYLLITAKSLNERIRLKNKAATAMLSHIRSNGIPKEIVFREAEQTGNEGIILAFANYILNYPGQGDLAYLLNLADKVDRLHVKYRVVQAIGELFAKSYATAAAADIVAVERVFSSYEKGADQNLLNLIKGTRVLIDNMVRQENLS
jgi:hypothetical protein